MPRRQPRRDRQQSQRHAALLAALADLPRARCLAPHKVKHRSLKAAQTAAEKQWSADRRLLWPYPCADHYHLTSQQPHDDD